MKTVNFLDAINSGKLFSPVGWTGSKFKNALSFYTWVKESSECDFETFLESINSQFELGEKTVTISESDFNHACVKLDINPFHGEAAKIKKELDFK